MRSWRPWNRTGTCSSRVTEETTVRVFERDAGGAVSGRGEGRWSRCKGRGQACRDRFKSGLGAGVRWFCGDGKRAGGRGKRRGTGIRQRGMGRTKLSTTGLKARNRGRAGHRGWWWRYEASSPPASGLKAPVRIRSRGRLRKRPHV